MTHSNDDLGVMMALLERFTKHRLPGLREIKGRVDQGEKLDDHDLQFLELILAETKEAEPLIDKFPELHETVGKAIGLYHEVTTKAVENEQSC